VTDTDLHDLRATLGAVPIERDVVTVVGPEAEAYLQGQLSQDVAALAVGDSTQALLLQPTGKLDAWLRVTRTADDGFVLDVEPGFGGAVQARLQRFKLRTKATFELTTRTGLALRGPGAGAHAASAVAAGGFVVPAGWPGVEGIDVLDPAGADGAAAAWRPADVPLVGAGRLDAARIEAGVPAMGAELSEATIPAEGGQWLIDASVSFTKGCYTGQELVARIDSRGGNVPRPVRGLRFTDGGAGPDDLAGAELVVDDGAVVGTVTSAGHSAVLGAVGLALVARTVPVGAPLHVRASGDRVAEAVVAELPLR
jgi:folate-binding protein YgfZ